MSDPSLHAHGREALGAGDFATASRCFSDLVARFSYNAEGWFLLCAARHGMHELHLAHAAFAKAAALDASHLQARFALATVCSQLGDHATAARACNEAVKLAPNDPQAWVNLALAQENLKQPDDALASYQQALALAPGFADALKNRGTLLQRVHRHHEAVLNNRLFVERHPQRFDAQFNLGESCLAAGDFEAAASALTTAVSLAPGHAKALLHAGYALALCERFAEAQPLLDQAAQRDPAQLKQYRQAIFGPERATTKPALDARTLFLLFHYDRIEQADWSMRRHFLQRFGELIKDGAQNPLHERALGFRALAMALDPPLQLALAKQIAHRIEQEAQASEPASSHPSGESIPTYAHQTIAAASPRRLKIGYLSPDFRHHPSGMLSRSLYARHDRAQFKVFGYALGGDDGSAIRREIAAGCDRFIDLDNVDDETAARRIRADGIDILIDLAGYSDRARPGILARRPAPLQITWIDYMATTGAPWIDYRIADEWSVPKAHAGDFSEAVIRLPGGLYPCSYATQTLAEPPPRLSTGLPASGRLLGALHRPFKIDPDIFALWMRLLHAYPDTSLCLLDAGPAAHTLLCNAARSAGVEPARLVVLPKLPHDAHLLRLQHLDLMLDTPQCSGGATTADALTAGVPVLTCAGRSLAQRMSASLLHAAGLDAMITLKLTDYEALAHHLLASPEHLTAVRQSLSAARTRAPFFAPASWVGGLEKALQLAWQRHVAQLPLADIEIPE